ncbi:MAG: hypothetical protein E3J71_02915 [Candidatus Stahlbacteria bacterium]|nr:MAG: hypothetical protein E3J71_02915 [Candidatus Stahlbacteria bacterium]
MPTTPTYILLEVTRQVSDTFPAWQQGLPQHTPAEVAAYGLGFLKGMLELGSGLFLEDAYKPQFEALLDAAVQHFEANNIADGLTQVETVILPKITEWVRPENRVPFRDIVDFATYGARFSGEYYFTPPLDEILQNGGITECTTIRVTFHIEGLTGAKAIFNCTDIEADVHVEKVTPPEEE